MERASHASNLRMAALVGVVALAVVLPLAAASAGPVRERDRPSAAEGKPRDDRGPVDGDGLLPGLGLPGFDDASGLTGQAGPADRTSQAGRTGSSARSAGTAGGRRSTGTAGRAVPPDSGEQSQTCGPQLTSPEGIKAQTCTIREGGRTWARTYYRNPTGVPLSGVLTMMRPDGRTVQLECPIGPWQDSGTCETPHERTVAAGDTDRTYSAMTEIASADRERMLLRAGSL